MNVVEISIKCDREIPIIHALLKIPEYYQKQRLIKCIVSISIVIASGWSRLCPAGPEKLLCILIYIPGEDVTNYSFCKCGRPITVIIAYFCMMLDIDSFRCSAMCYMLYV